MHYYTVEAFLPITHNTMKTYKKSLFLFHRDLRLHDNTGLIAACSQSTAVIPCFIFTPEQVGPTNAYKSDNAIQFMIEALHDLDEELKRADSRLLLFHDETATVIKHLITEEKIEAVFSNKDYTPFAQERDRDLAILCKKYKIASHIFDDALLNPPGAVLTKSGEPYKVFTPFWKASATIPVAKDIACPTTSFAATARYTQLSSLRKQILKQENKHLAIHGGRKESLKILKHIADFEQYEKIRDMPAHNTTLLSAHLKFGTLSPRETYHHMQSLGRKVHAGLIRQLYWRDFWYHIAYFYPHVFGNAFHEKYNNLQWKHNDKGFNAWCEGMTGFPIVDAGMRQLNETGFMHNRVRMIVASFLIKDLHISWRRGEQYFAQKLVDYDPCINNGNWQWVASTGCDPQPYFRIFNPWLQQKKYDPACTYIKQWIPELKHISTTSIHAWYKTKNRIETSYPAPILDHDIERSKTLAMYKAVL